jgi:hypothetical protein
VARIPAFRNYLCAHPKSARQFAAVKRALAGNFLTIESAISREVRTHSKNLEIGWSRIGLTRGKLGLLLVAIPARLERGPVRYCHRCGVRFRVGGDAVSRGRAISWTPSSPTSTTQAAAQAYAKLEFRARITWRIAICQSSSASTHGGSERSISAAGRRSTRFLRELDFQVVGVDIAEHMLALARERDPQGDFRLVRDGDLTSLPSGAFDSSRASSPSITSPPWTRRSRCFVRSAGFSIPAGAS